MAREEFLLILRNAARSVNVFAQTDGPSVGEVWLAQALNNYRLWLTPAAVDEFDSDDFPELPAQQRKELRTEVERFRVLAQEVRASAAVTKAQVREALPHFQRIVALTAQAVIAEWQQALDQLFLDVEKWSQERDWAVRRDPKRVAESFLGEYEVPRLLVHTTDNKRYFLDPIARFVVGGSGRVEMCLMPSYDSAAIVRLDGGWYVLPERPGERRRRWSRQTFLDVATRLASAA
jgi:hypothetical protein